MKKLLFVLLILALCSVTALAEENSLPEHFSVKNIDEAFFTVQPLLFIAGNVIGEASVVFEHQDELCVPFQLGYLFLLDEYRLGLGLKYRYYLNNQASGFFLGAGPNANLILNDASNGRGTSMIFKPELELGFRFKYNNFTFAPVYKASFNISNAGMYSGFESGLYFTVGWWMFDPASIK